MTVSVVPLRRVMRVVNGGTPTQDPENWDGGIPWATPVDLARVDLATVADTDRTLTTAGVRSSSIVPKDSLVLSTRAPIGYVAKAGEPMSFNQGCKGLLASTDIDPRFAQYWLWASRSDLQALGSGSTFLELSNEALLSFAIPLPRAQEQRRIADFLDDQTTRIDHMINGRKEQAVRLDESMESVVADDLAKQGRSIAAQPLRRFLWDVRTGSTPTEEATASEGIPWYTPASIEDERGLGDPVRWIAPDTQRTDGLVRFPAGSVLLVGIGATAGRVALLDHEAAGNQQLTALVPTDRLRVEFLLDQLRVGSTELLATAPFTTLPILNNETVRAFSVVVPSLHEQDLAVNRWRREREHVLALRACLSQSVVLLQEYRRSLISAAVSGEFDVSASSGRGAPA